MAEISSSFIFKVIFPVLAGVMIMGVLSTITVEGVGEQEQSFLDTVESFDNEVTLATDYEDEETGLEGMAKYREEFREALIYNAFSAQHCGLIPKIIDLESREGTDTVRGNSGTIFYPHGDRDHGFEQLQQKGSFEMVCAGAGSVKRIAESYGFVDFGSDLRKESGKDMEGVYGRMNFEVNNTFYTRDNKIALFNFDIDDAWLNDNPDLWRGDRWMSFVPPGLGVAEANQYCGNWGNLNEKKKYLHLLYGEDYSGQPKNTINTYEGGGFPSREGYYAYRVRMENVPMIKENPVDIVDGDNVEDYSLCNTQDKYYDNNPDSGNAHFEEFLLGEDNNEDEGHVKFVMCENATGTIQSNAGNNIDDDSESTNTDDSGWPEDVVYPKVTINSGEDSCIEDKVNIDDMESTGQKAMEDEEGRELTCNLERVLDDDDGLEGMECGLEQRQGSLTGTSESFYYYTPVWYGS